jgi:amino acid transporter/nucleotide-binding universal stress UspA family protein
MSNPSQGSGSHIPASSSSNTLSSRLAQGAGVIVIGGAMFTFIGYWRTAAIVLCDLASTAYYIGAIVEQSIGPAAPWFILAVMCFSYAVRWVYIESCTLFVRGGVYRVVREAMGPLMAKVAVSALLFDYILTGPISSVSAGQYVMGLGIDLINLFFSPQGMDEAGKALQLISPDAPQTKLMKNWGAVVLACAVTVYFFRENLRGIHESSEKALRIMVVTTIMGAVLIGWCGVTIAYRATSSDSEQRKRINPLPSPEPRLTPRINYNAPEPASGQREPEDPMGFIKDTKLAENLRGEPVLVDGKQEKTPDGNPVYRLPSGFRWLTVIGLIGIFISFGHSILAMSGEETLAQVYREVESPKLPNFKKAALIVFLFSVLLTGTISFLAVVMIPDEVRMKDYGNNLLGGLAMQVLGKPWMQLLLQAFVVVVGFLILSGAVNTAIIGSNGVLNRVAEDGVMPDWFLKPHPRYGTTYRILYLILGMQLFTIVLSQGDTFLLGEAYAFGVVWSFVFQALSMMVLRFKKKQHREFKVPLNFTVKGVEIPVGLGLILFVLFVSAVCNFLTKELATYFGVGFTAAFFTLFYLTERYHVAKRKGAKHEHVDQTTQQTTPEVTAQSLALTKSYRKLVAIRSTQNLFMLEKALAESDPETTGIVVMTAKYLPPDGGDSDVGAQDLDTYDHQLMTKVIELAEKAGKEVKPLIVPTNNPLHAVLKTAKDVQAHELIMGGSNKFTADEQLEQIGFYWQALHDGHPAPLTVRVISRERDMYLDLAGGNRIPKISERRARSVHELRAAGVGVDRVLLLHDGSPANSDLFQSVLTMLDDKVVLGLVPVVPPGSDPLNGHGTVHQDEERARQLDRPLVVHSLTAATGAEIVELAKKELYDVIVLPLPAESPSDPLGRLDERARYVVRHAHCRVLLATEPIIPDEVVDQTPSARR